MATIKVVLEVTLPGGEMIPKSELKGASKNKLRELTNHTSLVITYSRGENKKSKKPTTLVEKTRSQRNQQWYQRHSMCLREIVSLHTKQLILVWKHINT